MRFYGTMIFVSERVISCLGKEEVMDLVNKTRDVEHAGGLMTRVGYTSFDHTVAIKGVGS